jgi:DNA replication protein DnaC
MISEIEVERLKEWGKSFFTNCEQDWMLFDFDMEVDRNLDVEQNKTILTHKIKAFLEFNKDNKLTKKQINELELKPMDVEEVKEMQENFLEKERLKYNIPNEQKLYTEQNNFLIIGKKGSAKTSLAWSFAKKINELSNRKICVYNYPIPFILNNLPFKVENITRIEQLFTITDSVVIIDESHEVFNVVNKKINNKLKTLLSKSRQNNTCFIFICHNSYFVNLSLFSFIDAVLIKEVNEGHFELERKHIQRLYEDIVIFGKENFYIDSDYIRGHQRFDKPEWFSNGMSISYRSNMSKKDFFE